METRSDSIQIRVQLLNLQIAHPEWRPDVAKWTPTPTRVHDIVARSSASSTVANVVA